MMIRKKPTPSHLHRASEIGRVSFTVARVTIGNFIMCARTIEVVLSARFLRKLGFSRFLKIQEVL